MTTTQTISRERLEEIIGVINAGAYGYSISAEEIGSMARMLLAAMDSEPVGWIYEDELPENYPYDAMFPYSKVDIVRIFPVFAPPAPVAVPVMFIDGDISSKDAEKLAKVIREFNEEDERPLAKMARIIRENPHPTNECDMLKAQPAPVAYPDTLPCPVLFEPGMRFGKGVKTRVMLNFLQRRAERYAELDAMGPEARAEHDAAISELREKFGFGKTLTIALPTLPVLGSDAEWYQGFIAGARSMRDECKAVLISAGIEARVMDE